MINFILWCLVTYAIAFGLMNKLPERFTVSNVTSLPKETWLAQMLQCAYCTGFHSGWLAWLLFEGSFPVDKAGALNLISYALAGATLTYILDTAIRKIED